MAAGAAPSAERALATLVATSYLLGVSTRRVEKLAESFGVTKLSKSQVSLMAAELDGMVTSFRRDTAGPPPGLDAGHHLVSVRARRRRGGVRHWRRTGNARPGGAGRALAAAVGISRVVNGVHYPSDIAGGWAVGVGVAMLTLGWWPLRRSQPTAASAA